MPICPETHIAYDRAGQVGGTPLLLVHAGIADRRMWDPVWPRLIAEHDVIRLDLRGFGESTARPTDRWSPRADVLATMDALGVDRAHLVGCSFGSGVCVEVALERPDAVASLLLASPGGALLTERTDQLAALWEAEGSALDAGDLDAAAEANVVAWVDGPERGPDIVEPGVRDAVREMQRLAFTITQDWDETVEELEDELDPPATERYDDIVAPTMVLTGDLDVDSIRLASDLLVGGIPHVRAVRWSNTAHLPSMERPGGFADLVLDWVASHEDGTGTTDG